MDEQATYNGFPCNATFGLIFESGLKDMAGLAQPKPVETIDYPELNGVRYSTAPTRYEDADCSLDCFIGGSTVAVVLAKLALLQVQLGAGLGTLLVLSTQLTHKVRYKGSSALNWVRTGDGGVGVKFTLTLINCWNEVDVVTTLILDGNGS